MTADAPPARARSWLQVVFTGGAGLYATGATAVSLFVTARALGPDGRGVYAAAAAWVALFATFGSLSLGQVAIHHAAGRTWGDWLPDTAGSIAAILGTVVLVSWATVAALVAVGNDALGNVSAGLLALAFLNLPALLATETGRYLLIATDDLSTANRAQVVGATVGVGSVVVFVGLLRAGVAGALVAALAGTGVTAAITLWRLRRRAHGIHATRARVCTLLGGGARLHLNAIGTFLFTQASVLVLNHYRAPAETGLYQLAVQLFGVALILPSAAGSVAFAMVSRAGADGAWPEQRRLLAQALLLVGLAAAVGFVAAPTLVRVFAGPEFMPAVPLFQALLPALVGATLSTVMASQWIGRGLFLQASILTVLIGLLSLALDLVLIPRHGMHGALVSTLVTYGVSVVGNGGMAIWVHRRWRAGRARGAA